MSNKNKLEEQLEDVKTSKSVLDKLPITKSGKKIIGYMNENNIEAARKEAKRGSKITACVYGAIASASYTAAGLGAYMVNNLSPDKLYSAQTGFGYAVLITVGGVSAVMGTYLLKNELETYFKPDGYMKWLKNSYDSTVKRLKKDNQPQAYTKDCEKVMGNINAMSEVKRLNNMNNYENVVGDINVIGEIKRLNAAENEKLSSELEKRLD